MNELEELRRGIDHLDSEILRLLNRRMELSLKTKHFKDGVFDPSRESEILEGAKKKAYPLLMPDFSERIFVGMMEESKRLQAQNLRLAGFQGEHGAYGDVAVRSYDKDIIPFPCKDFFEIFEGIREDRFDFGIVPVENSIEGAVTQVCDLLLETKLHVVGEINVPIHHCLLTLPETSMEEIRIVYSHPQALAQCRRFISKKGLEPRSYYDTAGAAMMISSMRLKGASAIAGRLCADLYNLSAINENIEDHQSNRTRFLVLSKKRGGERGDKCSIAFQTEHRAGALFEILKIFFEAGINLTRIESRPIKNDPGKYAFLLDFLGSTEDGRIMGALEDVKKNTIMFNMLGCYKEDKG